MSKTLVTKLKATVDNPTLPVLHVMQQYTLDAIAASGNNSVTDNQKWALNELFYALDKYDMTEDSIWNKIEVIYLPLIAGSISNAAVNYKDLTSYHIDNAFIMSERGVIVDPQYTSGTRYFGSFIPSNTEINADNISIIQAYGVDSDAKMNGNGFCLADNNTVKLRYASNNTRTGIIESDFYISTRDAVGSVRGITVKNTSDYFIYTILNNNISKLSALWNDNNYQELTFSDKTYSVVMQVSTNNNPIQVIIGGEALPEDKMQKILLAVNTLRTAFYTDGQF